jgi:UPF0716 family protein affecting phage T7 exclusion
VDALLIFVAGVLLITPGIVTDAFGFALLIPPARALFKAAAARYFRSRIVVMRTPPNPRDEFIDVEVTDVRNVNPRGELP